MNNQLLIDTVGVGLPANENSDLGLNNLRVIASAELALLHHRHSSNNWAGSGPEPTLTEALNDPIVRLVMARDGVTDEDVYTAAALSGLF